MSIVSLKNVFSTLAFGIFEFATNQLAEADSHIQITILYSEYSEAISCHSDYTPIL